MIKRPCRVCGRWYRPNPRSRGHQKTCGEAECKKSWHRKKCGEWNKKNRRYFNARYLSQKLRVLTEDENARKAVKGDSRCKPKQPEKKLQGVVGTKALVIIEYIVKLLIKRFQDVKRAQRFDNTG
jgi:hypothetical protein